jgi:hypothetical protein
MNDIDRKAKEDKQWYGPCIGQLAKTASSAGSRK